MRLPPTHIPRRRSRHPRILARTRVHPRPPPPRPTTQKDLERIPELEAQLEVLDETRGELAQVQAKLEATAGQMKHLEKVHERDVKARTSANMKMKNAVVRRVVACVVYGGMRSVAWHWHGLARRTPAACSLLPAPCVHVPGWRWHVCGLCAVGWYLACRVARAGVLELT